MRYEERIIEQVQSANDIVEVISQYLPLKRSGRNFKGVCPFHQEKTPSFMVNAEKQIFHCFGCQVGGNVFTFLMRYENASFPEVLRRLAEKASIRLPESRQGGKTEKDEREKLLEVYQITADFYHKLFMESEAGRPARDYFQKRGFTLDSARELKIGWAPGGWRDLFEFLSKKGFAEALLYKAGLVARSAKGHVYDMFRERILFPIWNLQGNIVALGGRLLKDAEGPKYLNSPENPLFQKRRELFGLNFAKKYIDRERPQLFLVEGYFDFLGLYAAGFRNTVATLGTALSEDHVRVIKRFAEEAIVVYDGDKAGIEASLRGLEVFLEGGMNVKVVSLPQGFDPDDLIQKKGANYFRELSAQAKDFFDYKMGILFSRFDRADSLGLVKITDSFLETLSKIKNPILLDRYLRRLASSLNIEETSLRNQLAKREKGNTLRSGAPSRSARSQIPLTSYQHQEEKMLIILALEHAEFAEELFQNLKEEEWEDPQAREVFHQLHTAWEKEEPLGLQRLLNRLEENSFKENLVELSCLEWDGETRKKAFGDCLKRIKRKNKVRQLEVLKRDIRRLEQAGEQEQLSQRLRDYQTLLRENTLSPR